MNNEQELLERSGHQCELCGQKENLNVMTVSPKEDALLCCEQCQQKIPDQSLDPDYWRCLADSMWSEHSAVKVMTWRLLKNIEDQAWAADLLSQMYLEDELLEWASTGQGSSQKTVDSNGNQLSDGDTVTLIKDLDVKGANFTAKRGTIVKKIRLTDNPEHIEGKVNGTQIVLVANFLKKV